MDIETTKNSNCCADGSCGCHIDAYTTSRECPRCGKRLRLTGRAQLLEFRLTCGNCGYAGPLLSKEELGELI
jgi:ribosomal protein S27AE